MLTDLQLLLDGANSLSISLSGDMLALFSQYFDMVVDSNKLFNLTAITDEKDFIVKHFVDSLCAEKFIPQNSSLCDIGAGAGFPSVPLAIVRQDLQVTALDSTAKKMTFVSDAVSKLHISNLQTLVGRAEEQFELFETFDVVTARAVSSLPILLELCLPLVKVGGIFIAYKTDLSELDTSKTALSTLHAALSDKLQLTLPNGDNRAILVFKKLKSTPEPYPRSFGAIKKKPL